MGLVAEIVEVEFDKGIRGVILPRDDTDDCLSFLGLPDSGIAVPTAGTLETVKLAL